MSSSVAAAVPCEERKHFPKWTEQLQQNLVLYQASQKTKRVFTPSPTFSYFLALLTHHIAACFVVNFDCVAV